MKKKLRAAILAAVFLIAAAGCGVSKAQEQGTDPVDNGTSRQVEGRYNGGVWRYEETIEIPALLAYDPDHIGEKDPIWLVEWAKDKMNINFAVDMRPFAQFEEQAALYMASGNYASVILYAPGIDTIRYGDQEKILKPLQDYLINPDIMPNLAPMLDNVKDQMILISTMYGNIYSAPQFANRIENVQAMSTMLLYVDTRVSDKLGMGVPQTTDELLTFLREVKNKDPMELGNNNVPMGGSQGQNPMGFLLNAFGFVANYDGYDALCKLFGGPYLSGSGALAPKEPGEIVAMQTHPNFFEFLKYVNTLFTEGLLEPEYFTLDAAQGNAKLTADYTAIACTWNNALMSDEGWPYYIQLPPLTSPVNDKKMLPTSAGIIGSSGIHFVTDRATEEQMIAFMRFTDIFYAGPEGHQRSPLVNMTYNGPLMGEDDGYGFLQGFYYEIPGDITSQVKYPDVYDETEFPNGRFPTLAAYLANVSWVVRTGGPLDRRAESGWWYKVTDPETKTGFFVVNTLQILTPYLTRDIPAAQYPEELQARMVDLQTALLEHVKTQVARFITGDRPCTETEFAAYGAELEAMGYGEYCKNFIETMNSRFRP